MEAREAALSTAAPALHLQLLGPVRVQLDAYDITPKSRKARALIAYLACAEVPTVSRERIAGLLWSDRGEDQARASLRQALAELRAGPLGERDVLRISREQLSLDARLYYTDIAAILDAAEALAIARLADLLHKSRNAFLDNLDNVSPAFDEWLQVERVRQHDRIVTSAIGAAEAALESAGKMEINTILSALERLDPGNEHVVRIGLRADHRAGDTASLHRRYRRLVEALSREFGIKPSLESQALFNELSAGVGSRATISGTTTVSSPPTQPGAAIEPPIIMVSPLTAVDGREQTAELAEMCTDDIRVALGQFRDLRVLALATADPVTLTTMVEGALAGYVLSGKLRQVDAEIRINIQLANIGSGLVIWTVQLRAAPGALGEAVDEIVQRAAGAVMPAIERDLVSVITKTSAADDDLVLLYARARHAVRTARTYPDCRAGAGLLEAVIAADPRHLGARLLLARLYNSDFWQTIAGHDCTAFRARAFALVQEAAAIEPHNAQVQLRLAWCHLRKRAWALAEQGLEQALARLPYDADAMNEVGCGFWHLGDLDRAETTMQRAFRLNPFPPADYHADYAVILVLRREAQRAEEHFAVSGEAGLLYRSLRLANAWYLAAEGDLSRDLAETVWRDFAAIWQGSMSPTASDIADWLASCVVLRRNGDWNYISTGLQSALAAVA